MKVEELRVGNYVLLKKHGGYINYEISSGFDLYKLDESDCADISPIPLNEELLLRLGFKDKSTSLTDVKFSNNIVTIYMDENSFYCLDVLNQGSGIYTIFINIIHLHQLQNLYFALTGEELTIKL